MKAADAESHARITQSFQSWDNVDVVHRDRKISIHGNSFSGIARLELLQILHERCLALNIPILFRDEVVPDNIALANQDLLVGADGVNSTVRQKFQEYFQPSLSARPQKYIWYGTHQLFHGLTLTFREHDGGVFVAHSYKFNQTTSTFIVECDEQTMNNAGLTGMSDTAAREFLAGVFAKDLEGHSLLSNNSKWVSFVNVKNRHWSHRNVVLLGHVLHTAHFSIGSGTKLALEDAIALKECFDRTANVEAALAEFTAARQPIIAEYQAAAQESCEWFENARQYMNLSPLELAYALMTRSGRVGHQKLRAGYSEFIAAYEQEVARADAKA